jgi:hypothetical protein
MVIKLDRLKPRVLDRFMVVEPTKAKYSYSRRYQPVVLYGCHSFVIPEARQS